MGKIQSARFPRCRRAEHRLRHPRKAGRVVNIRAGSGEADCTITITTEDFQKLMENPQANGMQLFFAGKLKVAGNQMLAMKLQKLFSYR